MDNNELVTIVVPIYNVEKYLANCIESILCQTYKNLEILLIDDGSTDNSGVIADSYDKKDARITVYHKINGGLSDARNYGIDRTHGKFITFVDSDDYVSPFFVEVLYSNLIKFDADVSGCVYRRTHNLDTNSRRDLNAKIMNWNSEVALKKMLRQEDEFTTSACALLYKTSCFKDVRYPKGAYFEDLGTTYLILHNAKKVVRTSECLYHYYVREGSISNNHFEVKYMDQYKFAEEVNSFIGKNYPNLVNDANARLVGVCFNIYMTLEQNKSDEFDQYRKVLKDTIYKYRVKMILTKNTPLKVRGACLLSYLGMPFCARVYNSFNIKGR